MEKSNERKRKANRVNLYGLCLNISLSVIKFAAGVFGRSAALVADAVHSLSDTVTDIIVFIGFNISERPPDETHDYGHGRYATLASFLISVFLIIVGLSILYEGIVSIHDILYGKSQESPQWIAFYAAMLSVGLKEWLFRYTKKAGEELQSDAILANAWHHRSDAFSSIGTAIGTGGAIVLGSVWRILDPLAAVVVSFIIIHAGVKIASGNMKEFLEYSLPEETEKEIIKIIEGVEGARLPHNLKTRKIGNSVTIDVHVRVDKGLNIIKAHDISKVIEKRIKERFGENAFIYIHIEPDMFGGCSKNIDIKTSCKGENAKS